MVCLPWEVSRTEHCVFFCIVQEMVVLGPRLPGKGLSYACCPGVITSSAVVHSMPLRLNDVG